MSRPMLLALFPRLPPAGGKDPRWARWTSSDLPRRKRTELRDSTPKTRLARHDRLIHAKVPRSKFRWLGSRPRQQQLGHTQRTLGRDPTTGQPRQTISCQKRMTRGSLETDHIQDFCRCRSQPPSWPTAADTLRAWYTTASLIKLGTLSVTDSQCERHAALGADSSPVLDRAFRGLAYGFTCFVRRKLPSTGYLTANDNDSAVPASRGTTPVAARILFGRPHVAQKFYDRLASRPVTQFYL